MENVAIHNTRWPVATIHMGIVVPGLSGASFDAWDSVLRTVEDPGKVFFLPFILTIVVVIVTVQEALEPHLSSYFLRLLIGFFCNLYITLNMKICYFRGS